MDLGVEAQVKENAQAILYRLLLDVNDIHHMPVGLQGAPQQPAKPRLVLHHQDVHGPPPYRLSL